MLKALQGRLSKNVTVCIHAHMCKHAFNSICCISGGASSVKVLIRVISKHLKHRLAAYHSH